MKTLFCLASVLVLFAITGCDVDVDHHHRYRGGYYGPAEYGHGEYHSRDWDDHRDWDHDRDGYNHGWDDRRW